LSGWRQGKRRVKPAKYADERQSRRCRAGKHAEEGVPGNAGPESMLRKVCREMPGRQAVLRKACREMLSRQAC